MKITSHIILFLLITYFHLSFCQNNKLLVPLKDTITEKYGFVDNTDSSKFIVTPTFDLALPFNNDYARVTQNDLYTVINKKGELLFSPRFINLSTAFNNLLIAKYDSIYCITNIYGEPMIEFNHKSFNWEKEIYVKLSDTTIKDGSLIMRVLSMYNEKHTRFNEMINISFVYNDLAILILKYLNEVLIDIYGLKELNYMKSKNYKFIDKK